METGAPSTQQAQDVYGSPFMRGLVRSPAIYVLALVWLFVEAVALGMTIAGASMAIRDTHPGGKGPNGDSKILMIVGSIVFFLLCGLLFCMLGAIQTAVHRRFG